MNILQILLIFVIFQDSLPHFSTKEVQVFQNPLAVLTAAAFTPLSGTHKSRQHRKQKASENAVSRSPEPPFGCLQKHADMQFCTAVYSKQPPVFCSVKISRMVSRKQWILAVSALSRWRRI